MSLMSQDLVSAERCIATECPSFLYHHLQRTTSRHGLIITFMYFFEREREREGEGGRKRERERERERVRRGVHHVIVLDDSIVRYSAAQERWLGGWNCENVYLDNTTQKNYPDNCTIRIWRHAHFDLIILPFK